MKRFLLLCILLSSLVIGYDLQISEDGNTFSKNVVFQNSDIIRAQQNFTFESSAITITSLSRFGPFTKEQAEQNQNDVESLDKSLLIDPSSLTKIDNLEIDSQVELLDGNYYLTISQSTGIHDASFTLKCDVSDFDAIRDSMDVTQTIEALDAQIESAPELAKESLEQEKNFIIEFAKWQQDRVSNFEAKCEVEEVIVAEVICEGGDVVNGECRCGSGLIKTQKSLGGEGQFCYNPCYGDKPLVKTHNPGDTLTKGAKSFNYMECIDNSGNTYSQCGNPDHWMIVDTSQPEGYFCVPPEYADNGIPYRYGYMTNDCEFGFHRMFGHRHDARTNKAKWISECLKFDQFSGIYVTPDDEKAILNDDRSCVRINLQTGKSEYVSAEECTVDDIGFRPDSSNEILEKASKNTIAYNPDTKTLEAAALSLRKIDVGVDLGFYKNVDPELLKKKRKTLRQLVRKLPRLLINWPHLIKEVGAYLQQELIDKSYHDYLVKKANMHEVAMYLAKVRAPELWEKALKDAKRDSEKLDKRWEEFKIKSQEYSARLDEKWVKAEAYARNLQSQSQARALVIIAEQKQKFEEDVRRREELQQQVDEILADLQEENEPVKKLFKPIDYQEIATIQCSDQRSDDPYGSDQDCVTAQILAVNSQYQGGLR